MSGKKTKTTGQQGTENNAGAVSSPEMAPPNVADSTRPEPSVVLPGHYLPVGSVPVSPAIATPDVNVDAAQLLVSSVLPETDDVVVLEVRAVSERGFFRCGRFWSRQPVNVFASDDPEGDNAANNAHLGIEASCFISHADKARLMAEPNLIVKIIETVAEKS